MQLVHITTIPMSLVFLRGQVAFMRQRGISVHAVSSPGPELEQFSRTEGATITPVPMTRRITPFRDVTAVARIWRVLRRLEPTIVHAHTPKGGLLGMIAALLAGVPVRIYHVRGLPLLGSTGMKRRLLWLTEWLACRMAHQVLCVSRSVREVVIDQRICPADKIVVLAAGSGNGVDAEVRFNPAKVLSDRTAVRAQLGIPADAVVIGFVGRIVRDKGIVELSQAWQTLRARYAQAHLLLIGPIEPQDPIPAGVLASLQADARVQLRGMDWDIAPLYRAMDVVVLPTYREGFPNVPLEAAAMELPVVATEVPGCTDAVADGVTGTLVPARDAAALGSAIEAYLGNPELRHEHGRAGRLRVLRDYQPQMIWEALYLHYCELIEGRITSPAAARQREQIA